MCIRVGQTKVAEASQRTCFRVNLRSTNPNGHRNMKNIQVYYINLVTQAQLKYLILKKPF